MHRWSGWPGAWCLDCGQEDRREIACADGAFDIDNDGQIIVHPGYENTPCPEPGSDRYNPYVHKENVDGHMSK